MTGTELAAIYLTVALIPAGIAQAKGRSAVTWYVLGLILTPLLAGIVALWEPADGAGRAKVVIEEETHA